MENIFHFSPGYTSLHSNLTQDRTIVQTQDWGDDCGVGGVFSGLRIVKKTRRQGSSSFLAVMWQICTIIVFPLPSHYSKSALKILQHLDS